MWRAATILFLLMVSTNRIYGRYFAEGGPYQLKTDERLQDDPGGSPVYDPDILIPYQNNDNNQLVEIVDELQQKPASDLLDDSSNFQAYPTDEHFADEPNFDAKIVERDTENVGKDILQKENPEQVPGLKQPMVAEKKGQFEYESFVEPIAVKQLKGVESMSKRIPAIEEFNDGHYAQALRSTSNVVFIAVISVCCVVVVMGVVGGAYYYNVRKSSDKTFDDFMRYNPTGPGRDKKQKKTRNGCSSNVTENGDESMAYKAQLHHYQQTKQKIIGAEEGISGIPNGGVDEKSDDELEEHNYSVYECPGLAPTGDIEVSNPNFDIKHQKVNQ